MEGLQRRRKHAELNFFSYSIVWLMYFWPHVICINVSVPQCCDISVVRWPSFPPYFRFSFFFKENLSLLILLAHHRHLNTTTRLPSDHPGYNTTLPHHCSWPPLAAPPAPLSLSLSVPLSMHADIFTLQRWEKHQSTTTHPLAHSQIPASKVQSKQCHFSYSSFRIQILFTNLHSKSSNPQIPLFLLPTPNSPHETQSLQ